MTTQNFTTHISELENTVMTLENQIKDLQEQIRALDFAFELEKKKIEESVHLEQQTEHDSSEASLEYPHIDPSTTKPNRATIQNAFRKIFKM